jgi:hypothetical protein
MIVTHDGPLPFRHGARTVRHCLSSHSANLQFSDTPPRYIEVGKSVDLCWIARPLRRKRWVNKLETWLIVWHPKIRDRCQTGTTAELG